jgi:hypothetical protein
MQKVRRLREFLTVPEQQRFIVAEISKNWVQGPNGEYPEQPPLRLQFQKIIANNLERGYLLHSFTLHRLLCAPNQMNETIIAVFERK